MFISPTIFLDVDVLITPLRYVLSKYCLAGLRRADHEEILYPRVSPIGYSSRFTVTMRAAPKRST